MVPGPLSAGVRPASLRRVADHSGQERVASAADQTGPRQCGRESSADSCQVHLCVGLACHVLGNATAAVVPVPVLGLEAAGVDTFCETPHPVSRIPRNAHANMLRFISLLPLPTIDSGFDARLGGDHGPVPSLCIFHCAVPDARPMT